MKSSSFDENYLLDNRDSAFEDGILKRYIILLVESDRTIRYWDARNCASYFSEARSSTSHGTIVDIVRPLKPEDRQSS